MSSVYKVTEIEGKGLGCVAILDIEKGYIFLLNDLFLYLPIDTVFHPSGIIQNDRENFFKITCLKMF